VRLAIDCDASPHAGAQDHAEHNLATRCGAVGGFGDGEAVGVIGQSHFAAEDALEVLLQWPAVEAGGIGVLDQSGGGRNRPGRREAYPASSADLSFEFCHDSDDGLDRLFIRTLRRGHTQAGALSTRGVEHQTFDLCAAEIDSDTHRVAFACGRMHVPIP